MTSFERIRHPDACSAVILNDKNQVLLVKIKFKGGRWQLPGGLIERGESPWDSCVRLLKEEVGVNAIIEGMLGMYHRPNKDDNIFIFKASISNNEFQLSEEIEEVSYFSADQLPDLMNQPTRERILDCYNTTLLILKTQSSQ